jgi:hypothetical protein
MGAESGEASAEETADTEGGVGVCTRRGVAGKVRQHLTEAGRLRSPGTGRHVERTPANVDGSVCARDSGRGSGVSGAFVE